MIRVVVFLISMGPPFSLETPILSSLRQLVGTNDGESNGQE